MEIRPSVCPLDCPDRCALDVTVDQDRIVKIDGSDRSEYTGGYICAKVRRFDRRVYSPERLLHPMKRVGPKGSGRFEKISWAEAVRTIADRFAELSRTLGPESILPFHYDGSNGLLTSGGMDERFWNRLGASQLARTFCAANTDAGWSAVFGDMAGADPMDVRRSDAIVLWGFNPSASGIHLIPWVREARAAGAFLAVVDPRRTPMAREADVHLPVLPGTDVAVAMAMIRTAHEENLVDRAFVDKWTRGADRLVQAACTPEEAAALSGVRAEDLRAVVRAIAKSSAPFFRVGWGLERNRKGSDAVRAVLSLRALLGRFGRRGSGVLISTSGGYGLDRKPAKGTHLRKNGARTINMSRLGQALDETTDPPINALYVYNCNPVATAPNQARVVRALGRESLFVVVHEQVWTDTCPLADIILPATSFLEHTDLSRSYSGYAYQWSDPVISAPGEARPNHRVFSELARDMGFEDAELRADEESIARSIVQDIPQLRETRYRALPRPVPFVDAFPSRGYVDLAAPPGPPVYRPPTVDARLPLILISPASDKAITSQLFEFAPEKGARVAVAPAEAERRGLREGDRVRVRNSLGEVVAILAVTDELGPGVASMPKGLWRRSTQNGWTANALAPDHVDAQGGGACYNDARVEIEKA
ncbi:MAG: molybdopterin-dependent oxidoreductase [Planctomycetes bacterium]|nr:molybdopterin-dependent oxidoreductase [Planctomycetota bacterium]